MPVPPPDTQPQDQDQPDLSHLPGPADVRLVVTDMDGTLLDADGQVPEPLWPLLVQLRERGVVFSPASGRQYATLARTFTQGHDGLDAMVVIAENGGYVVRDGVEISSSPLDPSLVRDVVTHLRAAADDHDLGIVVCGRGQAYVERTDRAFLDHVDPYYAALSTVADVLEVDDVVVKVAVWTSGDPEATTAVVLDGFRDAAQVVVSGGSWVDVMPLGTDKGVAVRRLQTELGVTPAQTAVFGDYLNDLEMLDAAELSFAMEGAHPEVVERARYLAPSHRDHGVLTVIRRLLDL